MELVYRKEKSLFRIAFVISALVWLTLIVVTIGIGLAYILLGFIFYVFVQSAFISYLKGSGVKITAEQYPDLHEKLVRGCTTVGLQEVPAAYLLRTDTFNALATKFLGRHFVVLFTDVVDALDDQPGAIDFYIGHELGHIHRKHLKWNAFLMPASILPLLGCALRRAEEYTCDRYGVACCENEDDIKAAIAAIAAGDTRWKSINVEAYLTQVADTREFWMSYHELTSDYPWLTKRMAVALALKQQREIKHPRRHLLAWILSLFVPRVGAGGGVGSIFVVVAIIGVLAAIALPAYKGYVERARMDLAYSQALPLKAQVTEYVMQNNQWPPSLSALGYQSESIVNQVKSFEIGLFDNGVIGVSVGQTQYGDTQYIVIEPSVNEGNIEWRCYGEKLEVMMLPMACR